jgi:hypothetical protein
MPRAAVLMLILALAVSAAFAAPLPCPATPITTSTVIHSAYFGAYANASPLPGNACLEIAASNIVLDCNGYRITGTGTADTYGILLNGSLTNVTVKNCPFIVNYAYGYYVYNSSNVTLTNDTTYQDTQYGLYLKNSNATKATNTHLYNNAVGDFYISADATPRTVYLYNLTTDNPAGNFVNCTTLNITDTVEANTAYSMKWDTNHSALPAGLNPFLQKFVNITSLTGSVSIDSVVWAWNSSELTGYNITRFELWKYNTTGNWAKTNATLNTGANTLTLANMNPGSIYGVLENNALPNVSLGSPTAGYNASKRRLTFNCSSDSINMLSNITLYGNFTGSWQANYTNSVGGPSNSTTFTLTLSYARYAWNCLAYDTLGRSAWAPANYTFTANSLPIDSNFGGGTTDFTSELDLQNVSTPILENTTYGRLQWNGSGLDVAGADFNSYVFFGNGTVSVGSSHLSSTLNSSANITLYGLSYAYIPVLYSDGSLCTNCTILSYSGHNLAFTVPHFTNYSAGPNTNLSIYSLFEGGNVSKLTPITFYANYTNATDGSHVAGATCLIAFDDATSGTMIDTGSIYNFTKLAGFATTGIHLWNVICNKTGYETLTAYDSILVGPLNLSGNQTSLYMANVTSATTLSRFEYNSSGNLTIEGGNITGGNIGTEQLTDRWAAFYGNVSGSVILTDKAGANDVYQWGWSPTSGGAVCTSTNSTVTDVKLYPADGDDIDAAWSFAHTEPDSGRNTFNQTGCSLTIGTTPITNASYADTGQPGGFVTCSFKDTIAPAKPDMYFCTSIEQSGTFWNGQTGNFELMVPTAFGNNAYETYYFYVNLN